MAVIGQPVDDRDRAVFGKFLDVRLFEGADHDAVKITRKHAHRIFDRFAPAELDIALGKEKSAAAEFDHADFKADARARGGFRKDHAELFAFQIRMLYAVLPLIFELIGKIEYGKDLFG